MVLSTIRGWALINEDTMDYDSIDTEIPTLGDCKIESPLGRQEGAPFMRFVSDTDSVVIDVRTQGLKERAKPCPILLQTDICSHC